MGPLCAVMVPLYSRVPLRSEGSVRGGLLRRCVTVFAIHSLQFNIV